jgi:hypothetical protein
LGKVETANSLFWEHLLDRLRKGVFNQSEGGTKKQIIYPEKNYSSA